MRTSPRTLIIFGVIAALAMVVGCGRDATRTDDIPTGIPVVAGEQPGDGLLADALSWTVVNGGAAPAIELRRGASTMTWTPGDLVALNSADQVVWTASPVSVTPTDDHGTVVLESVYGSGIDLVLSESAGALTTALRFDSALSLPADAEVFEIRARQSYGSRVTAYTDAGAVTVGTEAVTLDGVGFTTGRTDLVHVPAVLAWDSDHANTPWIASRVAVLAPGEAETGFRMDASWLQNTELAWPATVAPALRDANDEPIIGSLHVDPAVPESLMAMLAATYMVANHAELSVLVEWGDGSTDSFSSNLPAYMFHTYAADGTYTVAFQVTHTSGNVAREEVEVTVGVAGTTAVTEIPFEWTAVSYGDCDWAVRRDDHTSDPGTALPFPVALGGQSFTHFRMDTNGYAILGDASVGYGPGYGPLWGITGYYGNSTDTFILAAYDDLTSDDEGFAGFVLGSDQVLFHWNEETYYDEGDGYLNEFQAVLSAGSEVQWNFNTANYTGWDYDLFTGLYFGGDGSDSSGVLIEIIRDEIPTNRSWVYR